MRTTLIAIAIAAALPAFSFAADAPTSPHSFTGNISLTSNYVFRGYSQTDLKPAIQGGADYSHSSGIYAGAWGSNVSWLKDSNSAVDNDTEVDFYAGYKHAFGDFTADIGAIQYYYPGSYPTGYTSPNTLEGYAAASYKWLTLKYSRSVTNLFGFSDSKGSGYLELNGAVEVGAGVTISAHGGIQKVANNSASDYKDWKLAASKDFDGLTVSLAYTDTNVENAKTAKKQGILTVGKTF